MQISRALWADGADAQPRGGGRGTCPTLIKGDRARGNGGNLGVAGQAEGNGRYKITVPAYAGYSYEVYGSPTLGALSWGALPFALTEAGSIDRHTHTATAEGGLDLYVAKKSERGYIFCRLGCQVRRRELRVRRAAARRRHGRGSLRMA